MDFDEESEEYGYRKCLSCHRSHELHEFYKGSYSCKSCDNRRKQKWDAEERVLRKRTREILAKGKCGVCGKGGDLIFVTVKPIRHYTSMTQIKSIPLAHIDCLRSVQW